eukprot:7611116-Heterocapsa_arctica.AAC.1
MLGYRSQAPNGNLALGTKITDWIQARGAACAHLGTKITDWIQARGAVKSANPSSVERVIPIKHS